MGWVAHDLPNWEKLKKVHPSKKAGKHPKTKHKSLDTSIMELADDIAYGVHDLEDAIGLKLITPEVFKNWFEDSKDEEPPRNEDLKPYLDFHHGGDFDDFAKQLFRSGTEGRKNVIGHLVGFFVTRVVRLSSMLPSIPVCKALWRMRGKGRIGGYQHDMDQYFGPANARASDQ